MDGSGAGAVAGHERVAVDASHRVDRHQPARVLLRLQRVLRVAHEDLVAQQVLPGEALAADRLDLLQPPGGEVVRLREELRAVEVGQLVVVAVVALEGGLQRSEEHTSELQSLMRSSYAVFCFKKKRRRT